MKAISLWQPWASLLVFGLKRFETRAYAFPKALKGQRIIIHAAKKQAEFDPAFVRGTAGYLRRNGHDASALPFGAIVGTIELRDAFQIGSRIPGTPRDLWTLEEILLRRGRGTVIMSIEHALGDFRVDRWAWECVKPRALSRPIAYSGKQGFFNVEDPGILGAINRQFDEEAGRAADAAFAPIDVALQAGEVRGR